MGKSRRVNAVSGPEHLAYGKRTPRVFDMALVQVLVMTFPMISRGFPSGVVR
jgi:hypothetical protein